MPSHKHKKKKKSHKRSKKYSSSSSEDTCSPWRVPLSDADSDVPLNERQLTALVRKTYINHLKQALTLNFENCIRNSSECNSESVEEMVHKWSSVLEQNALRSCMVSELYRTSMISLIKLVKTSTNDKKLYIQGESISRLKYKVPVNKISQTEFLQSTQEVETQTDIELPLSKLSSSEKPYDPAINFTDSNSLDGGVSSSLGSTQPQSITGNCRNQDICNISSTSDLIDFADLPTQEYRANTDPMDKKCESSLSKFNFSNKDPFSAGDSELKNGISQQKSDGSSDKINTSSKQLITVKKRQNVVEKNLSETNKNLDERLSALGLMVDNEEDSLPQPIGKLKRSNWYAEETAQSCNLTRMLMRMTARQREKVLKKIKDLFGDQNDPLTELSEANISICRKRIASVVVMELTPVYKAKRIASRHLFKYLAKKITRSIMEKSLAPDTKDIRWRVKKYFGEEKVIMSESDCT